jgi:hypothetical protein
VLKDLKDELTYLDIYIYIHVELTCQPYYQHLVSASKGIYALLTGCRQH